MCILMFYNDNSLQFNCVFVYSFFIIVEQLTENGCAALLEGPFGSFILESDFLSKRLEEFKLSLERLDATAEPRTVEHHHRVLKILKKLEDWMDEN
jgi:hypothetical protein